MKFFLVLFFSIFISSCSTTFHGSSHVDKNSCVLKCKEEGLVLDSMVFMGEYSSGCVCRRPQRTSSIKSKGGAESLGSVIGVIEQMRREQLSRANMTTM